MNTQTLSFCTNLLSGCKSVPQWNEQINQLVKVGLTSEMRAYIESSGLIVKILGVDKGQPRISDNERW